MRVPRNAVSGPRYVTLCHDGDRVFSMPEPRCVAMCAPFKINKFIHSAEGNQVEESVTNMRTAIAILASSCVLYLCGCSGTAFTTSVKTSSVQGTAIRGKVHGGQNPIVGARVYLYAANTSGYGNTSVSLLTNATGNPADGSGNYYVTTGSGGNFAITGDYTCPSTASQLYLYSIGGNPGAGTNSAAGLLAALGTCPASGTLSTSLSAFVDEVSTIAAAYAFAGYAIDATHVSSSGSALATAGIANAFSNAANLETLSTGLALATTPAGNGTVPQSEINTLANILAACVNSTGPGSTACSTLFADAKSGGSTGTVATDTATAAVNIAHNPAANLAALYALSTGAPPFAPALSAQPNDFTVGLSFTGGNISNPVGIAIDASGNAWIADLGANAVTELSSSGSILSGANGYSGSRLDAPAMIAIDRSGNAWTQNSTSNSIIKLSSSGSILSGTDGYTGGGLNYPYGIAIDAFNDAWVANSVGNSASEFSNSGAVISPSAGYTGGGLNDPATVAIDGSGNAWIPNFSSSSVTELSSTGAILSGVSGYTGGGLSEPSHIAIDGSGNVWITDIGSNAVTKLSNSGTALSGIDGYTGGGINGPCCIAIDGSGNAWISNRAGYSVTELSSSGSAISGSNGYTGAGLQNGPEDISIDGSGNVWVTDVNGGNVCELIGAATPVITPIAAGLPSTPTANGTSSLGTRP
jgi:streptogramin lyase